MPTPKRDGSRNKTYFPTMDFVPYDDVQSEKQRRRKRIEHRQDNTEDELEYGYDDFEDDDEIDPKRRNGRKGKRGKKSRDLD